jgi:hypothetical protein
MKNYLDPTFTTNIYLKDIMSTGASSTNIGNMKHLSVRLPHTLPQTLPQTLPRYLHHLASRHPVQGMNLRILVTHIRPLTIHNKGSSENTIPAIDLNEESKDVAEENTDVAENRKDSADLTDDESVDLAPSSKGKGKRYA